MNESPTNPPLEPWHAILDSRRGQTVEPPGTSYLFRFYAASEAEALVRDWHQEIGLDLFYPVGHFCCGDFVCAHPSGTLFVVLHDDFEWWDSEVSFDEFMRRLDAHDIGIEEDMYARNRDA